MSEDSGKKTCSDAVIEIRTVSKAFGMRAVLKEIDLQITGGGSVCVCGVNGAGKSTLLRMVAGLLQPDKGAIHLCGYDVRRDPEKTKPHLGVISHGSMVYAELTVSENLFFFARLYGVPGAAARVRELLEGVGLFSYRYDRAGILSRGLLQRLAIARALVHQPSVLLADEPFTGLDSEASAHLLSVLSDFRNRGGTILMTTHAIHVGLECCDRVVVLDKARLIFDAKTSDIDADRFSRDYLSYARSGN